MQSGEALGAIAEPSTLELLERLSSDERPEVAETCQIASRRVRWVLENGDKAEELVRCAAELRAEAAWLPAASRTFSLHTAAALCASYLPSALHCRFRRLHVLSPPSPPSPRRPLPAVRLQGNMKDNPFESVDPAPAARKPSKEQVPEFERQLLDTALPLFERYKAMFSLRNNRSRAAILVRGGCG